MHSITTLFFTLSALAARSHAAPSSFGARDHADVAVFAGAPSDYPADMESAEGWESEGWKPAHDDAGQAGAAVSPSVQPRPSEVLRDAHEL